MPASLLTPEQHEYLAEVLRRLRNAIERNGQITALLITRHQHGWVEMEMPITDERSQDACFAGAGWANKLVKPAFSAFISEGWAAEVPRDKTIKEALGVRRIEYSPQRFEVVFMTICVEGRTFFISMARIFRLDGQPSFNDKELLDLHPTDGKDNVPRMLAWP